MGITERIEEQEIEAALQREIPDEDYNEGKWPSFDVLERRAARFCKKLGCPLPEHRS